MRRGCAIALLSTSHLSIPPSSFNNSNNPLLVFHYFVGYSLLAVTEYKQIDTFGVVSDINAVFGIQALLAGVGKATIERYQLQGPQIGGGAVGVDMQIIVVYPYAKAVR